MPLSAGDYDAWAVRALRTSSRKDFLHCDTFRESCLERRVRLACQTDGRIQEKTIRSLAMQGCGLDF